MHKQLNIRIHNLVLEGVSVTDVDSFKTALAQQLQQHFSDQGTIADLNQSRASTRIQLSPALSPQAAPSETGRTIASALTGAIGNHRRQNS